MRLHTMILVSKLGSGDAPAGTRAAIDFLEKQVEGMETGKNDDQITIADSTIFKAEKAAANVTTSECSIRSVGSSRKCGLIDSLP